MINISFKDSDDCERKCTVFDYKTVDKSIQWKKHRENVHSDCMISSQSSIGAKHSVTLHKQPWCYTLLNNNHKEQEQENSVNITNKSENREF